MYCRFCQLRCHPPAIDVLHAKIIGKLVCNQNHSHPSHSPLNGKDISVICLKIDMT